MSEVLEEFLEEAEQYPQEIIDKLTRIRELDLSVENAMDSLDRRKKLFFSKAGSMQPIDREIEHKLIKNEHARVLGLADEKVKLACELEEMINKFTKRLDVRIANTKKDLDKDNPGTSERIERKYLSEINKPSTEKASTATSTEKCPKPSHSSYQEPAPVNTSHPTTQKMNSASSSSAASIAAAAFAAVASTSSGGSTNYNRDRIGSGVNAIAAAASQAIAATQQMQQGRRTASLKAGYEAINSGGVHNTAELSRDLTGSAQSTTTSSQELAKKNKKKVTSATGPSPMAISAQQKTAQQPQQRQEKQAVHQQETKKQQSTTAAATTSAINQLVGGIAGTKLVPNVAVAAQTNKFTNMGNPDFVVDDKKYCICNQVSYGEMVACDNSNCPHEWFHYPCVNITVPPKGKWYCPKCNTANKRRAGRKN